MNAECSNMQQVLRYQANTAETHVMTLHTTANSLWPHLHPQPIDRRTAKILLY